jgi:hypothetical protein
VNHVRGDPILAQKFGISCVPRMPPIADPAKRRRRMISGPAESSVGPSSPSHTVAANAVPFQLTFVFMA